MKSQKGITLIALIITVIVMLLLVGVTINVALDGGLMEKSTEAAMKNEKKAMLEQIIALSEWSDDGKIDVESTIANVKKEFGEDKVTRNQNTVTIKGKHGSYNYIVTTREISEGEGTGPQNYDEYYFTFNMIDGIEQKVIKYEVDEETGASSSMIMIAAGDFWGTVGADLSGEYSISIENFDKTNEENLIIPDNTSEFAEVYNGTEVTGANNVFAFAEQEGYVIIVLSKNPGEEIDFANGTNTRGIVSMDGDPENNVLSWEEFLELYGDIKFSFKGTENKPDTDYYGYYKANATIGSTSAEVGYYISEQSYYIGDLYKIQKNEYDGTKNGYSVGECSVIMTFGAEGFMGPFGYRLYRG